MKNIKKFLGIALMVFFVSTNIVIAIEKEPELNVIKNSNGVVMTLEEYEKLNLIYGDDFADIVDIKTFNKLKEVLSRDIVSVESTYVKTKTKYGPNDVVLEQENEEITEVEYNTLGYEPMPLTLCGISEECWETTAKKINLVIQVAGNGKYYAASTTTWKSMPKVRSNDLSVIRFATALDKSNSYSNDYSYVMYQKSGTTDISVNYGFLTRRDYDVNGTAAFMFINTLPSDKLTSLKIYQEVGFTPSSNRMQTIQATYQHASKSISSTTASNCAKNANIGNGYGGILLFSTTCQSYFDGMGGVSLQFAK